MAFLDNSGDIILDAVLTDTGRMRLAKGDGSFRITKFALGDDEINYSLYSKNNPSGSAYYDVDILTTPVFEAFTNNISSLNSRLLSITRTDLLFLPVMIANNLGTNNIFANSLIVNNGYIMGADQNSQNYLDNDNLKYSGVSTKTGLIKGIGTNIGGGFAPRIDQGIDNNAVPPSSDLDPDLKETQYLVEFDNRFGRLVSVSKDSSNTPTYAIPSYIDDDNIAAYYFTLDNDTAFVTNLPKDSSTTPATNQVIDGARGTSITFSIAAGDEILTSPYLFNQIGKNETSNFTLPGTTFNNIRSILTYVTVTGLNTGYSVSIPIKIFKFIS